MTRIVREECRQRVQPPSLHGQPFQLVGLACMGSATYIARLTPSSAAQMLNSRGGLGFVASHRPSFDPVAGSGHFQSCPSLSCSISHYITQGHFPGVSVSFPSSAICL